VLLDVMLPKVSGIDVCREIRKRRRCRSSWSPPRARRSTPSSGLEVGADDYVTKPYRLRELVARMRARAAPGQLERRERGHRRGTCWIGGDVRVDPERHEVTIRGEPGAACRSRSSSC
jgi:two-component system, OmpR family, response regulator RegX3